MRIGPSEEPNSQIHALGDGAEKIRLQTKEVLGSQARFCATTTMSASIWQRLPPLTRAQAPKTLA
jgi:hypothetical protein